ncbi:MAG: DUF3093 domain-containing protein [Microbacteriaceae bacterium]
MIYRERLWASIWFYLALGLVIPASIVVFLPINPAVGIIAAIVLYGACVAVLIASSPVLEVTEDELRAGKARLPLRFAGDVEGFSEPEATLQRGQRLDARAWLLIRGWVGPVVRIDITDPGDPTPYWLVSTRHPERLCEALIQAKQRTPGR